MLKSPPFAKPQNDIRKSGRYASRFVNGEDSKIADLLKEHSRSNYEEFLGSTRLLMIDEFSALTIIASGSSSFDLANQTGEPLVGRSITFRLFPLAQLEIEQHEDLLETRERLATSLIYGAFPKVVNQSKPKDRIAYLEDLVSSYLLKDILMFNAVKNTSELKKLLVLLALQVGSEVKYEELGTQLGMSRNTIERYLDLLT